MPTKIWLRSETKPAEKRTVLTPEYAGQLINAGFDVTVEESTQSIFPSTNYSDVGCRIVREHSWRQDAGQDAIILGLKELENADFPLSHRHIHFAHVYKEQAGWKELLGRFKTGGGSLLDLEFLVDDSGARIAAFGHWAGFAGAGLAVLAWCNHVANISPVLNPVTSRSSRDELIADAKSQIQSVGSPPTALVIGARGRCGKGAIELLKSVGVQVTEWDLEETKAGGPFPEILEHDIFLNCVFVEKSIPPFVDLDLLSRPHRRLSVICDVSCDPYGDYNPVPIYDRCTTFDDPILTVTGSDHPLHLIAIDHLPSLLPRESSIDFCGQLMPHLLQLNDLSQGVWHRALQLFEQKIALVELEN